MSDYPYKIGIKSSKIEILIFVDCVNRTQGHELRKKRLTNNAVGNRRVSYIDIFSLHSSFLF
nr:MAG TPA: hypothetical protein [Caudoviricetes sp.]